ncbi:MAG: ThiF family adenylyltransferase [Gemmataceae bacterium]
MSTVSTLPRRGSLPTYAAEPDWQYEEAFCRHRGLLSERAQARLRRSRIAVAGLGGVGGIHVATLARLGIGAFHLADRDRFEVANFNRQHGATLDTVGQSKAVVLARAARAINPSLDLRVFNEGVDASNVDEFLEGADVYVDGIDFFAIETRRLLFREARRRGIWAVTAGPLGFSTAWLVFSPTGLSFDDYFDLHDGQTRLQQLVAFAVGLAPRATHLRYLDLMHVDLRSGRGPSAGLACQLCAGVIAAEIVKILLGHDGVRAAPCYFQFDAYRHVFRQGRLRGGNRHPWQRFKRWWLERRFRSENSQHA